MVKVKMLTSMAGPAGTVNQGNETTVSPEAAERYFARGYAEPVDDEGLEIYEGVMNPPVEVEEADDNADVEVEEADDNADVETATDKTRVEKATKGGKKK